MNPLQRRLFRLQQPGMSRQPMGILASSPQMMEAARRNMNQGPLPGFQTGGSVNVLQNPAIYGNQNPFMTTGPNPVRAVRTSIGDPMAGVTGPDLEFYGTTGTRPPAPLTRRDPKITETDAALMSQSPDEIEAALDVSFDSAAEKRKKKTTGDEINESNSGALGADRTKKLGEDLRSNINTLRASTERIIKGAPTKDDVMIAGKSVNQAYDDLFAAMDEEPKAFSDYSLADYEDAALEALGFDKKGVKETADEDRKTAFWMSLMKAGLATAAGESQNTITNLARGLSFGLESYGKDISKITDQEREDNRQVAAMKLTLLKDDRDLDLMKRANKIQKAQALATAAQAMRGEELQMMQLKLAQEEKFATLENTFITEMNKANMDWEKLAFDKDKFNQTLQATLAAQTPDILRELAAGDYIKPAEGFDAIDFANPDSMTMTEEGRGIYESYLAGKGATKITDLMQSANVASDSGVVDMLDFGHLGDSAGSIAKNAAIQIGKANLPSDPKDRPAVLIPYARAYGAQSSSKEMIDYVIQNSVTAGVTFYDRNGAKIDVPAGGLNREAQKALQGQTAFIEFARPNATLAQPVG